MGVASGCGASAAPRRKLGRIGLQLYTVRELMRADVPGTLARVAEVGYKEVEFAGYFGKPPAEIRALLAHNGLTSPSTHVPFESLRKDWSKSLDAARQIGHLWVTIAWIPEEVRRTLDAWRRLAAEFNSAARTAREAGLRFAYHNYDYDLKRFPGADGHAAHTVPLELLIAGTDPSLVDIEMDLYWLVKGGGDPSSYFATSGKRFPMLHVKDSAGPPAHTMTDVGRGSIDFRRIFSQADKAEVRHVFVEHDQPADAMASIRAGYDYLRSLEY